MGVALASLRPSVVLVEESSLAERIAHEGSEQCLVLNMQDLPRLHLALAAAA
jgi:hypothetical protein